MTEKLILVKDIALTLLAKRGAKPRCQQHFNMVWGADFILEKRSEIGYLWTCRVSRVYYLVNILASEGADQNESTHENGNEWF